MFCFRRKCKHVWKWDVVRWEPKLGKWYWWVCKKCDTIGPVELGLPWDLGD